MFVCVRMVRARAPHTHTHTLRRSPIRLRACHVRAVATTVIPGGRPAADVPAHTYRSSVARSVCAYSARRAHAQRRACAATMRRAHASGRGIARVYLYRATAPRVCIFYYYYYTAAATVVSILGTRNL